jgi:hypothetical protein
MATPKSLERCPDRDKEVQSHGLTDPKSRDPDDIPVFVKEWASAVSGLNGDVRLDQLYLDLRQESE